MKERIDSPLSLPIDRKRQYGFVYKTNFMSLLKCSLLLIPFGLFVFAQLISLLVYTGPIVSNSDLSVTEKFVSLLNLVKVVTFFLPISLPVLSIGLVGVSNVLKKIIYNDGFILFRDFKAGIKEGKQGILLSFVLSILLTLLIVGVLSLYNFVSLTVFFILLFVMALMMLLSFVLLQYQNLFSLYYYQNSLGNIKNSFLFTFHSLFSSFGILFLEIGVFTILYCVDLILFSRITFLTIIGIILQMFFFQLNGMLIFQLNAVSKFDKVINSKDYPDMYRKGLYNEQDGE